MKIGVITLGRSYSYGACLQTFATLKIVRSIGHQAVLLDYTNPYEQNQNKLFSVNPDLTFTKNFIYSVENIVLGKHKNMRNSFEDFHGFLGARCNPTDAAIVKAEEFDCLISGSDQLWNPDIFGGLDTSFFLDFAPEGVKRISYAASAGSHIFNSNEIEVIRPLLEKYNAISVREESLKDQIDNILHCDSKVVLDPTLLISRDEWIKLLNEKPDRIQNGYILLYMIGVPYSEYLDKYLPLVRYYANKMKLPVYAVSYFSYPIYAGANYNLSNLTPFELVEVINNASLIITSSFHGVAFSINLNRPFLALRTDNYQRIGNLLKITDLTERFISDSEKGTSDRVLEDINYVKINKTISELREDSIEWLRRSIEY